MSAAVRGLLVVDDQDQVRLTLGRILQGAGYDVLMAGSVAEARSLLSARAVDLVLCDIDMPGESGLVLVDWLAAQQPATAILMVTACDDPRVAERALTGGADGYLVKPFDRNEVIINVASTLRTQQRRHDEQRRRAELEELLEARTGELARSIQQLGNVETSLDRSYEETVWRLACAAEYRDPETASHLSRISRYAMLLATSVGCSEAWSELLRLASPMHDVGKLGIPDEILMKPGRFTAEDRAVMAKHSEIGHRILAGSSSPLLQMAAEIALNHHEWWDGSGYPNGRRGEAIPLEGRIVAIVDVFDALTSARRYKPAMSVDEAFELMSSERGTHFDPDLLDAFVAARDEVERIRDAYAEPLLAI